MPLGKPRKIADRLAIAGLALLLHTPLFLHQPVLSEARQFLFERGGLGTLDGARVLRGIFEPTGYNSRFVSMLGFRIMRDAFGLAAEPVNLVQIGLVALAAVLILEYVGALAASRATGRLVAVLWLLSVGTANALSWQATNHEKLCLVFTLATVLAVGTVRSRSLPFAMAVGLGATVLAAFALNAKELAFFLAVVLPVQGFLFAGARVVLPTLYVIAFAGIYLTRLQSTWGHYAFAETSLSWLFPYSAGLVGFVRDDFGPLALSGGGPRVVTALLALAFVIAACGLYVDGARKRDIALRVKAAAVLGAWWATCLVILLNPGDSLYCLLVPSVGFLGTLVVVVEDLSFWWGGVRGRFIARSGLVAFYAATFLWMLLPGHALGRHLAACRNVAAAHAVMRRDVPEQATGPFVFVLDGGNDRMRWLFFDSSERCVMNFALLREGDLLPHSIAMIDLPAGSKDTIYFRFDRAFRLREIVGAERP